MLDNIKAVCIAAFWLVIICAVIGGFLAIMAFVALVGFYVILGACGIGLFLIIFAYVKDG
jgi:hypothetical protein